MSGRAILITGAASGIGAAAADRLIGAGDRVLLHTRRNERGLARVAETLRGRGATVDTILVDLADSWSGKLLIDTCIDRFGALDILIANAGYADRTPVGEVGTSRFDEAHGAIARSFFDMAEAGIAHLEKSPRGRVVAVGAFGPHVWRTDLPAFPATAAAKAAMEAAARALALRLAPSGATVNVVAPGFIEKDPGTHRAMTDAAVAEIAARIPMGRRGLPSEVANVIRFLASEEASYVTGQVIHVNGGLV